MSGRGDAGGRNAVIRQALRNGRLRRALAAFLIFNIGEWAIWIALLVWAFRLGGVQGASAIALAQLVPSALLATPAASWCRRLSLGRALTFGYALQATFDLVLGTLLLADAAVAWVAITAVIAAVSITLTRPVHNALLPEISQTTGDLTAGNAASGIAEALAVFVGPLLSGLLVATWDPGGVPIVMGVLSVLSVVMTWPLGATTVAPVPLGSSSSHDTSPIRLVLRDPAARLLSAMVAAENVLVGMMDILIVVLALELLDMSDAGPGVLNSAIGLGGMAGAAFTFVLVGRRRLAPALLAGALAAGLPLALAGLVDSAAVAFLLIAVCGAGKSFFDVASRTFVQRLLPDRLLTAVFGLQESFMMAGLAIGTLTAPILVEGISARGAFVVAGLFLPCIAVSAYAVLRRLDRMTDVPTDVLGLLLAVPILSVLAPRIVERLACEAIRVDAPPDEVVVTEGEPGQRFYVVDSGRVVVTRGQETLRELGPGGWFGEIALLRDVPRTASVTAVSDVTLWAVDRESLLAAVAAVPRSREVGEQHAREHYR